ncbi:MAG: tyrosine-type recombinase/integrase [Candidatus Bipolaricaulia bacterium]
MPPQHDQFQTDPVTFSGLDRLSLSQGLDAFLLSIRVEGRSPQTIDLYRRSIEPLIRFLGDSELEQITSGDLRQFIVHLQERVNPTTVGIRWRSIRAFFNWVQEEGWLVESPTSRIKSPKTPQTLPNVLSHVEVDTLMRMAKKQAKSWHGRRN